jgi:hypothetical protein
MATTSEAIKLSETASVKKGFGDLTCPSCGEETRFTLDLDDCCVLRCGECEAEHSEASILEWLAVEEARLLSWKRLLGWINTAPVAE